MTLITSHQNRQLKLFRSLEKRKYRAELGLIPLEGRRLVVDVLTRGVIPDIVFVRAGTTVAECLLGQALPASTTVLTVNAKVFDQAAFTESPQGVLAIVKRPRYMLDAVFAEEPAFILVVDGIQDPGNLGTMIRSAAAAGASGVILLPGTVDVANPKAIRASMGAYFALPVVETTLLELHTNLQARKVNLVLASIDSSIRYDHYDWTQPVAVVIGNEGVGVSQEVKAVATNAVDIPMAHAVESLNAAIAMSVLFFEASRQRRTHL
ncbi:MAG: RNA methyltransferase [Firmicutes bacterium]|nr:RNA methyltransferase [Bacillota bacterium]